MLEDNKEKLPALSGEELAEHELEEVSGGQIELSEDEAPASAGGKFVTNGITESGGHWA